MKEYWIVNPTTKTVTVYRLNFDNQYEEPEKYSFTDSIIVGIYTKLELILAEFI